MEEAARFVSEEEKAYPVLPENWEAVQLFLKCGTQWRLAGLAGVRTGLDYCAVESVMRMTGTEDTSDALWRLQLIEDEALSALADKQDKA